MFDQELLARLRDERFSRSAWLRFLGGIPGSAKEAALKNPAAVRSLLAGGLLVLVILFLFSLLISSLIGPSVGIEIFALETLWLAGILGWGLAHIGLLRYGSGIPASGVGLPNWLTIMRLSAAPLLFVFLDRGMELSFLSTYAFCGLTDLADGLIARRRRAETRFGTVLDPLADVVVSSAVFVGLFRIGIIPWYVFLVVVARYSILLGGAAFIYVFRGPVEIKPTFLGKLTGGLIMGFVGVLVLAPGLEPNRFSAAVVPLSLYALSLLVLTALVQVVVIGWVNLRRYDARVVRLRKAAGESG